MGSNSHVARTLTFAEAQMQYAAAPPAGSVNPYQQFQPPQAAGAAYPYGQAPAPQYTYIQVWNVVITCDRLFARATVKCTS